MESKSFNMSDDKLIIALDFGTTYSGIAYCFANQRDNSPISVDKWAGKFFLAITNIPNKLLADFIFLRSAWHGCAKNSHHNLLQRA